MAVKAPSRPAGREGGGRVGEVRETQPLNRPPVPTTGRTKQKWPVAPEKYNNYATNSIANYRDNCDTPNDCSLPAALILPMTSLLAILKVQSCIPVSPSMLRASTHARSSGVSCRLVLWLHLPRCALIPAGRAQALPPGPCPALASLRSARAAETVVDLEVWVALV